MNKVFVYGIMDDEADTTGNGYGKKSKIDDKRSFKVEEILVHEDR